MHIDNHTEEFADKRPSSTTTCRETTLCQENIRQCGGINTRPRFKTTTEYALRERNPRPTPRHEQIVSNDDAHLMRGTPDAVLRYEYVISCRNALQRTSSRWPGTIAARHVTRLGMSTPPYCYLQYEITSYLSTFQTDPQCAIKNRLILLTEVLLVLKHWRHDNIWLLQRLLRLSCCGRKFFSTATDTVGTPPSVSVYDNIRSCCWYES